MLAQAGAHPLTPRWERAFDVVLLAPLLGLSVYALARRSEEVRDGAGYVTTASNVAWAILTVLALLAALQVAPLPRGLKRTIRWAASIAVAFHSLGLLVGLYATIWWFDDALHTSYGYGTAVLLVRVAQSLSIFPPEESTRSRAALLGLVAALAVAAAWEIFEYVVGAIQASRLQADLDDTMLDMIDGVFGGLAAAFWLARHPTRPATKRSRAGRTISAERSSVD